MILKIELLLRYRPPPLSAEAPSPYPLPGQGEGSYSHESCSRSIFASRKSGVSNPSVKELKISPSARRASARLLWRSHRRLKLMAARSSNDLAFCPLEIVRA